MCGRTALTASPEDLREAFGLDETPRVDPHYNVPPSRPVAAVRVLRDAGKRALEMLRWGLVPYWADDPKIGHRLALARVETVATTPAFRDAIKKRRCLVVVDGFYEWKREGKKASQPFFVRRADRATMALAGVWDRWTSRDGEVVESCAILTQPSRAPVAAIHDRMPLVLDREAWDAWLDPARADVTDLLGCALRAVGRASRGPQVAPREPPLVAFAVSPHVNDPRHDDAKCVEPGEAAQRTLF